MKDYLDKTTGQTTFKVSQSPNIDYLIDEGNYEDALNAVNSLIEKEYTYENLNLKGIILNKLERFDEAIECFDNALNLKQSDEISLNRASAYYDWAKVTFFPTGNHDLALDLINNGLEALPESEDPSEYYFLKAEILEGLNELVEAQKAYLTAYKEFDKLHELESQIEYLKSTSDVLINIVGTGFYNFTPEPGNIIDLVRDEENEHDSDAIAVVFDGKSAGYVANNPYTLIDEVKSASDIKDMIGENQKAEILFNYIGEYVIAKLI